MRINCCIWVSRISCKWPEFSQKCFYAHCIDKDKRTKLQSRDFKQSKNVYCAIELFVICLLFWKKMLLVIPLMWASRHGTILYMASVTIMLWQGDTLVARCAPLCSGVSQQVSGVKCVSSIPRRIYKPLLIDFRLISSIQTSAGWYLWWVQQEERTLCLDNVRKLNILSLVFTAGSWWHCSAGEAAPTQ